MKQLFTYFSLAYLISWIIWLPLYAPSFGINNLPLLPYHHALGGLGPLIASILATWIYLKKEGVHLLIKRCLKVKPLIYLSMALLSPFILALFAAIINYLIHRTPFHLSGFLNNKEFPNFNLFQLFIYNLIFFGFGEELGWRGFALPRFQKKLNAFTSSLLLTFFWAIWHWPLFLYRPGYVTMDIAGIIGWTLSLFTGSILLTWFYNSTNANLLICAIFHSTVDIAFTADFADKNMMNYMGILITVWGILTIIIFKPKNLAAVARETG